MRMFDVPSKVVPERRKNGRLRKPAMSLKDFSLGPTAAGTARLLADLRSEV